ncbi:MAG: hypothetical protein ACQEQL_08305 [Pseudomonadota bacterium]
MGEYSRLLTGPSSKTAFMVLESIEQSQSGQSAAFDLYLPALMQAHYVQPLRDPLVAAFLMHACGPENREEAFEQFAENSEHIGFLDIDEFRDWFDEVLEFEQAIADGDLSDFPFQFQVLYASLQEQYYKHRFNDMHANGPQDQINLLQKIDHTIDLLATVDQSVLDTRPGTETLVLLRINMDYLEKGYDGSPDDAFDRVNEKLSHLNISFTLNDLAEIPEFSEEQKAQLDQVISGDISTAAGVFLEMCSTADAEELFHSVVPSLVRLDETEGAPEGLVAAMLLFNVKPEERQKAVTMFCQYFHGRDKPEAVNETLDHYEQLQSFYEGIEQNSLKGKPPVLQQYYLARQDVYFEKRLEDGRATQRDCVQALRDTVRTIETLDKDVQSSELCSASLGKMHSIADLVNQYLDVKQATERLKGDFESFKKNKGRSKDGFQF